MSTPSKPACNSRPDGINAIYDPSPGGTGAAGYGSSFSSSSMCCIVSMIVAGISASTNGIQNNMTIGVIVATVVMCIWSAVNYYKMKTDEDDWVKDCQITSVTPPVVARVVTATPAATPVLVPIAK